MSAPDFALLDHLQRLGAQLEAAASGRVDVVRSVLGHVTVDSRQLPLLTFALGSRDPAAPTFMMVGGVHGLERIGSEVVMAYMQILAEALTWDATLRRDLRHARLAFFPIVNPVGVARGTRANGRGVDLMRNAPRRSEEGATPLLGGHRISRRLPWFAGNSDIGMEREARALVQFAREQCFGAEVAIALDCHSGFGHIDRLWFPYAHSRAPYPSLPETAALAALLDRTLPNHVYRVEPQAQTYTIRGDLWDHIYDLHREARSDGETLIPLTLEMGSWNWVRKNPWQLLRRDGGFHPVVPHRVRRTLRRHLGLFDFLRRASASGHAWTCQDVGAGDDGDERTLWSRVAYRRWYAR